MNNIMLVGRLTTTPQLEHTETNQKYARITLAITRPYKNVDGEYETDFIPVMVYNEIAHSLVEYTRRGDLIGVKGRLENVYNDTQNTKLIVVADKVTFLSANTNPNPQTNTSTDTPQTNPLNEGEI